MVASIYHFHFNYIDNAYDLAYYHYWQSLSIRINNANLLYEFLEILGEPDFILFHMRIFNWSQIKFLKETLIIS